MRPTPEQLAVLARIEGGLAVRPIDREPTVPYTVETYQWSRDANAIVAHRTVRRDGETNPRLMFRTELFRIQRDGTTTRL